MSDRPVELGYVLPIFDDPATGETRRWDLLRSRSEWAEEVGFDTVWVADELVWKVGSWVGPTGWWECVALLGAVASVTSKIAVGSWVLSALHRNPGLTAKVAETVDEISGGRFIFGFGAGHAGGQGEMFGYPLDLTVGRYEESLEIIVSLLRTGEADHAGEYHTAKNQVLAPRGPRPGNIPLMLGGHGPRTVGLAVRHADIWSAYGTESSLPEAFAERIALVDRICEEQGRDPASLRRSVGVVMDLSGEGIAEAIDMGVPLGTTVDECVDRIHELAGLGVDSVEFMVVPDDERSLDGVAAVVAAISA